MTHKHRNLDAKDDEAGRGGEECELDENEEEYWHFCSNQIKTKLNIIFILLLFILI